MMNTHAIYIDFGGVHANGIIEEEVLLPVHAENEKMVLAWIAEMNKSVYENQVGKFSLSHFDAEYGVFWIKTPANLHTTVFARLGYGCYSMAQDMRWAGTTDWQFPYLWTNTQTTHEIPQPPQKLYQFFKTVIFQYWEEFDDLQLLLDKLELRFSNYDIDGQWIVFGQNELEEKESAYWGNYFNASTGLLAPYTLGMLFEIGVHLCHAFATNLWNHPPDTLTGGNVSMLYKLSVSGLIESLAEWRALPDTYYQKQEKIAEKERLLARYLVIEPMENKIAALKTLIKSRPLLAREQLELESLQSILAARDIAEIDALWAKISNTPTDAELRKRLIAQAQAKRDLIVDNNI
jgi:hypothetical protein